MQQPVRVLLPWVEREDALLYLLGRLPRPGEDTKAQIETWERSQAALAARAPYATPDVTIEALPEVLQARAQAFAARPDVQAGCGQAPWELGIIDLSHVLSFQRFVALERLDERFTGVVQDDWESLFSICFPALDSAAPLAGMLDQSGKAITISSVNPNLRVAGHIVQDIAVPGQNGGPGIPMRFFGFAVHFGTSFIQIAEYNGRLFVRDGYHRCYAFLQQGIRKIPCVIIHARTFAETGGDQPMGFRYETLFGDRPPQLTDFLDEKLSVTAQRQSVRKVVRISAEDFVVES